MKFYHWFSSHPNEIELSGGVERMQTIGKELRIVDAKQAARPKQTDFRWISSVPDIWSQHRLFEMLLLNKAEDPSYIEYEAIAVREWRAMLAILVLAESYGVTIRQETIQFSNPVSSSYLRAAYDARPNRDAWPSMDVYYIEKDGVRYPIAMSSATVHVVPTKDAWRNLREVYEKQIPWLTDNQVHAPVVEEGGVISQFRLGEKESEKTPAMMPVHALMLARWMDKYHDALTDRQKKLNAEIEKRESDAEKNAVKNAEKNAGKETAANEQTIVDPIIPNIQLIASYRDALNEAFNLKTERMPDVLSFFATGEGQSGVKIGDQHVPLNLKLFLDRAFYAVVDQASSLPEVLDTHRFAGGIAKECLISRPLKSGKIAHIFVAMPVTGMFWQLWRANESLKPVYSLKYEFNEEGMFLNKLTASVAIGDITFAKTYNLPQLENDFWRNLCTAGIWPRQKLASWEDYYLFCNEIGGYRLEPEEEGTIQLERSYSKKENVQGTLHYYKLNRSPERCRLYHDQNMIGYLEIRHREEIPTGDATKTFRASIDFGTSATTMYGSLGDAAPERLSGMNFWCLPLMNTVDIAGRDMARLEKYFVPPLPMPLYQSGIRTSFAEATNYDYKALMKNSANAEGFPGFIPMQTLLSDAAENNGARQIFADCWIYFRAFMNPRQNASWPNTFFNLKWNHSGQADQFRIKAILTELLIMTALEARVNGYMKLSITATYPLSFDSNTRKDYFSAMNDMLEVVARLTGLEIMPPPSTETQGKKPGKNIAPLVGSMTESEAVYRYSAKQDSFNQNYFVIDVGGGSTDIFLSLIDDQHQRNSFATSLGFGARKVLLDKISHSGNLILRMLIRESGFVDDKTLRDSSRYILEQKNGVDYYFLEDMFSLRVSRDRNNPAAAQSPETYGDFFLKTCAESTVDPSLEKLDPKSYREDLSFLELKKRVAFYLGASVWLSGLLVRGGANDKMDVSLLFAGNGSKMIHWLSPDIGRIRHFITSIFQKASGADIKQDQMNCRFSAKPKEEVAYGALVEFPIGFVSPQDKPTKQVSFGEVNEKASELGAFQPMLYVTKNIKTDMAEFAAYMRAYRSIANLSFDWEFLPGEYDEKILENGGINAAINRQPPSQGYFLNALETVASWNMREDDGQLTY